MIVPDAVLDGLSVERRARVWIEALGADGSGSASGSFTLVAEQGGEVVGFCSVSAPSRDEDAGAGTAEIAALYVSPCLVAERRRWGARGRGVGRAAGRRRVA